MFGLGFRPPYYGDLVDARPAVDWLELVSENFLAIGGRTRRMLERLRADYPLALHGVSLSIAGADPLDADYLAALRALIDTCAPRVVSDHLAWSAWRGRESHDLLPLPYTRAMLAHVAARVGAVQERLGCRLYLENPTAYVAFAGNEMDEAEFLAALCARTGCGVLLDVNNLIVNAANLGSDPQRHLDGLPRDAVAYLHVAGHTVLPDVRIDTHDEPVPDPVWALYRAACARFPDAGTILERDDRLPPFPALLDELVRARREHAAAPASPPAAPRQHVSTSARQHVVHSPSVAAGAPETAWPIREATFFAAATGGAAAPALAALAAAPVSPARGLRVYADAFPARIARGLRANFPTLAALCGAARFEALIAAYLAHHPPRGYAFTGVGAQLASFLAGGPAAIGDLPAAVCADVAAFEQAELDVHDAPDDGAPLPAAALAEVPEEAWPALRVRCTGALRVVRCAYDVLPAIEAVAAGAEPSLPPSREVAYLVCRPEAAIVRRRVTHDEATVIERLIAGAAVGEACAGVDLAAGANAVALLATVGALRELAAEARRRGV